MRWLTIWLTGMRLGRVESNPRDLGSDRGYRVVVVSVSAVPDLYLLKMR
jgi:hypothetical protein